MHKGLGEMQTLAAGVGDLKHLLTNVKTRGIFGEAQLAGLLEQVFVVDQYAAQVATRPGSKNMVDFAIKLPGKSEQGQPLWLPIDAKFPNEDYERLLDAQGRADALGVEVAGRALESRIRLEARSIADKYIEPPHTTDFAILFLPTEGLYAEVLRRPGLMESLQRDHRITLAGPTTLLAMLSSLQMGFRRWRWRNAPARYGRCWVRSRPSLASLAMCWPRSSPKPRPCSRPSMAPRPAAAPWDGP